MRKHKTPHRHPIRGLFLTLSATIVCTTLCTSRSFAHSAQDNASLPINESYVEENGIQALEPNSNAYEAQSFNSSPSNQTSSQEFAAQAPQIKSVYPLGWEARVADGFQWTDFTLKVINQYGTSLNNGAKDVTSFCPNYNKLGQDQKINFWGQLISAMALYESGFKPTSHFREGTMGIDPITKQHVYSDGLLQLSYQDVTQYHFCDEFNWAHDSQYGPLDPRKTIFDPYINLRCGIRILNAEIARTGLISYRKGQYWSVLWPAHVAKIKAVTRKIPYCASK